MLTARHRQRGRVLADSRSPLLTSRGATIAPAAVTPRHTPDASPRWDGPSAGRHHDLGDLVVLAVGVVRVDHGDRPLGGPAGERGREIHRYPLVGVELSAGAAALRRE